MNLRNSAKFGLAAFLLALTTVSARADLITATRLDGTNGSYTATVTDLGGGMRSLSVAFDPGSMVTRINGVLVSPNLNADFSLGYVTTILSVTPTGGGDVSVSVTPFPGGVYGVQALNQVLFDYNNTSGNTFHVPGTFGLSLGGTVNIDPASPLTQITANGHTYDFGQFSLPNLGSFTITLNSSDNLIADIINGSGTFGGSASFSQVVSAVPEPASIVLLGVGGILAVAARRRKA
jgi:hypothetical protein